MSDSGYDPDSGDAISDLHYLTPTKYVVGDEEEDGHTHVFYLRDDLPIATTASSEEASVERHSHSIEEGPGDDTIEVVPYPGDGHTHTTLVVEEAGDYNLRTIA